MIIDQKLNSLIRMQARSLPEIALELGVSYERVKRLSAGISNPRAEEITKLCKLAWIEELEHEYQERLTRIQGSKRVR